MHLPFDPSRGASPQILRAFAIMTGACALVTGWAGVARIDISSMGTGQVIPNRRLQVVQNLEGGILRELLVKEGQMVKEGQPVARFQDTEFSASLAEAGASQSGFQATLARLNAEIAMAGNMGRSVVDPVFPAALRKVQPDLVAKELQLFRAHIANLRAGIDAADQVIARAQGVRRKAQENVPLLRNSLALAEQQRAIVAPQVARGNMSKLELLGTEQKALEIKTRIVEAQRDISTASAEAAEAAQQRRGVIEKFRGEALTQLTEIKVKEQGLKAQVGSLKDKVDRRQLLAPTNGIVKKLFVNTVGAVLRPGENVLEIVPSDGERFVEARFAPQDIAFIHEGQKAYIRLTAYDASIYGSLDGEVAQVSADATTTEREEVYYRVQVRAKGVLHDRSGVELPIVAGMVAQVDVLTGKRTLLEYWLQPITRLQYTALHER